MASNYLDRDTKPNAVKRAPKKPHPQSQIAEDRDSEAGVTTAGFQSNGRPGRPIAVLFLTTSLEMGGAQMMLYKLLAQLDRTRFAPKVISLIDNNPLREKIESLGVEVRSLHMRPGIPNPISIFRLISWLRRDPPDVIQTWMYHADLIGGLAAKLAGGIPVAWGIRHSNLSNQSSPRLTIYTMKICARASRWLPARIVSCSEASQRVHAELGYATQKMLVIPNGFNVNAFTADSAARDSVRVELQIPVDAPLIGLVGRFDPQKDHRNFVRAAALIHHWRPDVHFLLCGDGINWENRSLRRWIEEAEITKQCRLIGRRHDMARVTAALDIALSSSSYGEGFPNVIGEAMSCGVPCVVTDVGDSALIVGQTGRIVAPRNSEDLAKAVRELIELGHEERTRLGIAARCRIKEHFDLPNIVRRYQNLYQELASGARA
jgi:glycosyltransferase involved in cell wall biosynthesis